MPRVLNSSPRRLALTLFGILVLAVLVWRAGPANLLENMRTLGWGLALIIALGGVAHVVKSWAWGLTLLDENRHVSFARLLGLRLASEAAGQFGLFGQAVGETLRVSLLNPTIPLAGRIASVALDRALFIFSTTAVTVAGLVALLLNAPLSHKLSLCAGLFSVALLMGMILAVMAVRNRWRVLSGAAKACEKLPFLSKWLKQGSMICSVEHQLLDFWHSAPRMFCLSLGLNIVCQYLVILEVYLTLKFMGFHIGIAGALAAEALTKLVNMLGALTPGNVGLYEGGNMVIAKLLGLTGTAGLAVALARRSRAIFWAIIGGLCFFSLSKPRKLGTPKKDKQPVIAGHGPLAVILAGGAQGRSRVAAPLARVHGIPVLLRAILRARKAGASRIVIAVNGLSGVWLDRELISTHRVPDCLEWLVLAPEEAAVSSLFDRLAGYQQSRVMILDGACVYHPHLYRILADWNGDSGAMEVTSGAELVGCYALSPEVTTELASHVPIGIETLCELHHWLTSRYSVECTPIEPDKWQRVSSAEDRMLAERKLDRWIVKVTDGIFARTNRKVSIPISHQLLKFPITPNMVSLFTLGVSFLAGVFFARGGYWSMLLGATLSLFASILDGCDGEVARLKLLESDFGCWLETACDYLYYLVIYAGMAIGLARTSGNTIYLKLGVLFFFGAISTFVIAWVQRQHLTNGRPEQLLQIWQKKAESQPSNLFLYLGRRLEFLVRRCFLPYALLFFAALNITRIAFLLSVVGVNVAWPIALYSWWAFSRGKRSVATRTVTVSAQDGAGRSPASDDGRPAKKGHSQPVSVPI